MMLIRFLFLSLLVTSCGKNVQIKSNQLESIQQITEADVKKYQKAGTLNTSEKIIVYSGQNYTVSKYSSHQATTFINSQPGASQIPILFIGGIDKQEIVIESIQRQ